MGRTSSMCSAQRPTVRIHLEPWERAGPVGRAVLPTWYDPFPWVQLSEFQKWSDVNQLALGLFTNTAPPSSELTRKINEWKRLPDPEQRVLAALRFVQDEIRESGHRERRLRV